MSGAPRPVMASDTSVGRSCQTQSEFAKFFSCKVAANCSSAEAACCNCARVDGANFTKVASQPSQFSRMPVFNLFGAGNTAEARKERNREAGSVRSQCWRHQCPNS
eukprot:572041-Amphidinium_carterae.1